MNRDYGGWAVGLDQLHKRSCSLKLWAFNSVGQSASLTRRKSGVRISQRPPTESLRFTTRAFLFVIGQGLSGLT